jgi:hypothetical protein
VPPPSHLRLLASDGAIRPLRGVREHRRTTWFLLLSMAMSQKPRLFPILPHRLTILTSSPAHTHDRTSVVRLTLSGPRERETKRMSHHPSWGASEGRRAS